MCHSNLYVQNDQACNGALYIVKNIYVWYKS